MAPAKLDWHNVDLDAMKTKRPKLWKLYQAMQAATAEFNTAFAVDLAKAGHATNADNVIISHRRGMAWAEGSGRAERKQFAFD